MDLKKYIDITPLVSSDTATFPGDKSFVRNEVMSCDQGDHLTLSSITTSVHIGAHVDAPNHYAKDAIGIDKRVLDYYMGPCQVIDVSASLGLVRSKDFSLESIKTERVLFKTSSYTNPEEWTSSFTAIHPQLVDDLSVRGVKTLGIDTPSIDPATSKALAAHAKVSANDMAILEGVYLENVEAGEYILMALPLKLKDCDASPVRALLFTN